MIFKKIIEVEEVEEEKSSVKGYRDANTYIAKINQFSCEVESIDKPIEENIPPSAPESDKDNEQNL